MAEYLEVKGDLKVNGNVRGKKLFLTESDDSITC